MFGKELRPITEALKYGYYGDLRFNTKLKLNELTKELHRLNAYCHGSLDARIQFLKIGEKFSEDFNKHLKNNDMPRLLDLVYRLFYFTCL